MNVTRLFSSFGTRTVVKQGLNRRFCSEEAKAEQVPKKKRGFVRKLTTAIVIGSGVSGVGYGLASYYHKEVHSAVNFLPESAATTLVQYLPNEPLSYIKMKNMCKRGVELVSTSLTGGGGANVSAVLPQDLKSRKEQEKFGPDSSKIEEMTGVLHKLKKSTKDVVDEAGAAANEARRLIQDHEAALNKAMTRMENDPDFEKEDEWDQVRLAFEVKEEKQQLAMKLFAKARDNLQNFNNAIFEGRDYGVVTNNFQDQYRQLFSRLEKAESEMLELEQAAPLIHDYDILVREARDKFYAEIGKTGGGWDSWLSRKSEKDLTVEDLNAIIMHAHVKILQLQQMLVLHKLHTNRAADKARASQLDTDKKNWEILLKKERDMGETKLNQALAAKEVELNKQFEAVLAAEVEKLSVLHGDHLVAVLKIQEEKLKRQFDKDTGEALLTERQAFNDDIAENIIRMKAVECAIEERAEIENRARQAQELWLACQALVTKLSGSSTTTDSKHTEDEIGDTIHVDREVKTIQVKSLSQPFVQNMIFTLPSRVLEEGLSTEKTMRRRFKKVRKVAESLALVSGEPSLWKVLNSKMRSMIVVRPPPIINHNDEIELAGTGDNRTMDPFLIFSSANYCIENGDWQQALRYMNQLEGVPRQIAADWIEEARLLISVQSVANVLTAYASASALTALFQ